MELETSPTIATIAGALALAQAAMEGASKDGSNPAFKSKYATLTATWDACREALTKNKIAVVQAPFNGDNGDIGVTTLLAHASGEWMRAKLMVKPSKFDAQGAGSVITYLRRYLLAAMVGVAPEDDDGEAAVGRPSDRKTATPTPAAQAPETKPHPESGAKMNREFAATVKSTVIKGVEAATSADAIDKILATHKVNLEMMKKDYPMSYDGLVATIQERKAAIADGSLNDEVGDLGP